MEPYTVAGLARRMAEENSGQGGQGGLPEPTTPDSVAENPGCTKYKLQGVVVHQGIATAGHYYTYIRTRETADPNAKGVPGQWLKFNDDAVTVEEVRWAG